MYTFDGENKLIILSEGVIEFDAKDLYSRWKEWCGSLDNAKYVQAFNAVGGEPVNPSGTQIISPYFFLINGWKIRPYEANHQLTINGNLLSLDGSNPVVKTLGNYNVFIRTLLSVNSTTTSVNGQVGGDSVWSESQRDNVIELARIAAEGLSDEQISTLNKIQEVLLWSKKAADESEKTNFKLGKNE